jgi:hypothetical protein
MKATEDVDRAPRGWGAAMPTESGFSFDGLVNPLRLGSARIAMETRDSPAIYMSWVEIEPASEGRNDPVSGTRIRTL